MRWRLESPVMICHSPPQCACKAWLTIKRLWLVYPTLSEPIDFFFLETRFFLHNYTWLWYAMNGAPILRQNNALNKLLYLRKYAVSTKTSIAPNILSLEKADVSSNSHMRTHTHWAKIELVSFHLNVYLSLSILADDKNQSGDRQNQQSWQNCDENPWNDDLWFTKQFIWGREKS